MNIKPPNKRDETYRKYKYLIWRDDVGFLHLEGFTLEELERFSESIEAEKQNFLPDGTKKSLTIKE